MRSTAGPGRPMKLDEPSIENRMRWFLGCFDMRSPRPKEHLKRQDVWLVAAPGWRLASNKTITSSRLDGPLTLIEEEHSVGHLHGGPSGGGHRAFSALQVAKLGPSAAI
jgi:hypothetical protein